MKIKAIKLIMLLEVNKNVVFVAKNKAQFMDLFFDVIDILKENKIDFYAAANEQTISIDDKKIIFKYSSERIDGLTSQLIIDEDGLLANNGVSNIAETKH